MADDDAAILEFARGWAEALVGNDADAIGAFMTDDWIIVGGNGATSRADFLRGVARGDLTHSRMAYAGDVRVRIHRDTAVVTGRIGNEGRRRDRAFSADEWTTDVLFRQDGRWLCALSHVTPADAAIAAPADAASPS